MMNKVTNITKQLFMKRKNKKGQTMIELIIVIAIIVILAVVTIPHYLSTLNSSKISSAETNIKVIGDATLTYYTEMGSLPDASSIADLREILINKGEDPNGETKGPWLQKNMKETDPWGHEYEYEKDSSTDFDIISEGPDGDSQNQLRYSTLGNKKATNSK